MGFEEAAEDGGGVFAELAVIRTEGSEEVGVDVELASNLPVGKNGDDDFGFGFDGAGEVAWVCVDIVDDDGFAAGGRRAADALIEGNTRMRGHGALEGAQHEDVATFLFEHIEANPIVLGELFMEQRDDGLHERFGRDGRFGEGVEFGNEVGGFQMGCGHATILAN